MGTTLSRSMGQQQMGNQDDRLQARHVPGTGFWNGASTLKQYFVLPKNGSKYYLKYTFLAFPVLGILGLGTPLDLGASSSSW